MPTLTEDPKNLKKNRPRRPKVEAMPAPELPPSEPEPAESPSGDEEEYNEADREDLEQMAEDAAAPSTQARKRGRPMKGEVRSPATAFFERHNATPNFRETSQYWGYRLEPITDMVATGRDKYIGMFQEPLDEDKMLKHPHFGSGVYMLMFKSRNAHGQMVLVEKLDRLDIENPQYPPCIPSGAWLDDRRNARWEWAKKIYDQRAKEEAQRTAPPPAPMTVQDTMAIVESAIDRKLSSGPKEGTVLEAVRLGMETVRASAPQGGNELLTIMREALADSREKSSKLEERVLNLLTERANPAHATGPVTIEDQAIGFAKVVEAVDKVRPPKSGGRGPEPEHPGWKILDTFVGGISPGLNALIGVLAQKAATGGQPAQQQQQRQANRPEQPQAQQPVQQVQATPAQEVRVVEVPAVLQQHFQLAFDKCMQGESPEDFADWLHAGYPTAISELRQIGSENPPMPWSSGDKEHADDPNWGPLEAIMDIAKHQPVWKFVAMIPNGEARLTAFVKGVLEWVPSEDEEGVIQ